MLENGGWDLIQRLKGSSRGWSNYNLLIIKMRGTGVKIEIACLGKCSTQIYGITFWIRKKQSEMKTVQSPKKFNKLGLYGSVFVSLSSLGGNESE